jgi:hypothetical protein
VLRDPVIGILLAGVAKLLAGDPLVDGLVLLTVAAALGWDRVRRRGSPGGEPTDAPDAPGMAGGVRLAMPPVGAGRGGLIGCWQLAAPRR